MSTVNPYLDLDEHARLMEQLRAATTSAMQVVERARAILQTVEQHNGSETAHPDIRQLLRSAAILTVDDLENVVEKHNNRKTAHPELQALLEDTVSKVDTTIASIREDLQSMTTFDGSVNRQLEAFDSALASLRESLLSMGGELTAIQNANNTWGSQMDLIRVNATSLQQTIGDLQNRLGRLIRRVNVLDGGGDEGDDVTFDNYIIEIPRIISPQEGELIPDPGDFTMVFSECEVRPKIQEDNTWYIDTPSITAPLEGEVCDGTQGILMTWTEAHVRTLSDLDIRQYVIDTPAITSPQPDAVIDTEAPFLMTWTEAVVREYQV